MLHTEGTMLSFVVPCYNEEEALPLFFEEAVRVAGELQDGFGLNCEFVFVNDGSSDGTLDVLHRLAGNDTRVHYVSFSRNFGKEAALLAGLHATQGSLVAVLDADLQDPPSLLPRMVSYLTENPNCDCVATRREDRAGEPVLRSAFARLFYRAINGISETPIVDGARDFRLMTRRFVDSVLSLSEVNRFSKGLFSWVGYETHWISFGNVERIAGETKWNFWGLCRYAMEGITDFSSAPLSLASLLGIACCAVAFLGAAFIAIRALAFGDPVAGWPSLACIMLLIGGLQFLCIGILGQYVAKMYTEVKRRPSYIVAETDEREG